MMKTLKVLTIFPILMMIGSGCSALVAEPLCLPARPILYPLSIEEQRAMEQDTLEKVAINDARLKSHIKTIEQITEAHNTQFKAKCADEVSTP